MPTKPTATYDVDFLRRIEDATLNDQGLARDAQILKDFKKSDSDIYTFFQDKCVLISGATGFVGKILLEKLLRTCSNIKTVFILIRKKEGKGIDERMKEFFDQMLFDRLNKKEPNFRSKIVAIEGDAGKDGLGLSEEDRRNIQEVVSVIFHAAASDQFDEPLRQIVRTDVRGTAEMLKLATECPKLESFVHFSTAFSNCTQDDIYEQFYESIMNPLELINLVENTDDETLVKITPQLIGKCPNTYIFAKAVTEQLIKEYGTRIPVCLFRSSICIGTYKEPMRGFADNIHGFSGLIVGTAIGLIHTAYCNGDEKAEVVPVDMVANAAIACAWRTAQVGLKSGDPLVYNYVSGNQQPITYRRLFDLTYEQDVNATTMHAVWNYSLTLNKNWYLHMVYVFFLHYVPGFLADTYFRLTGKKPRVLNIYKKIQKRNDAVSYFTTKSWNFSDTNVQDLWKILNPVDQQLFFFHMGNLDWARHAETYLMGLRVYFLKDPMSTIPEARIKRNRLKYMHLTLKAVVTMIALYLIWFIVSTISI